MSKPWISGLILLLWGGLAFLGPWLNLAPNAICLERILAPPSLEAWLGFDDLGRPLWDRWVVGARTSFLVALGVISLAGGIGTVVGALSGYFGGWWDHITVRVMDIFLAFPGLLLAIALAGVLGPGVENTVFALGAVGWVGYARLARAQVLSLRSREHLQAIIALGGGTGRILRRHLLPLIMAPLLVEATFGIAGIVVAEASLSFLGLGVQPPAASWGSMIRDGSRYLLVAPHTVLVPGAGLMLVVLAVNLLGDWLRDRLDIRRQE
jgi:peptide/nickel transport system permease protein